MLWLGVFPNPMAKVAERAVTSLRHLPQQNVLPSRGMPGPAKASPQLSGPG
jgi:hypothetical protein